MIADKIEKHSLPFEKIHLKLEKEQNKSINSTEI